MILLGVKLQAIIRWNTVFDSLKILELWVTPLFNFRVVSNFRYG